MLKLRVGETHLGFSNLIIGLDEEKALVKAAEQCLVQHLSCVPGI